MDFKSYTKGNWFALFLVQNANDVVLTLWTLYRRRDKVLRVHRSIFIGIQSTLLVIVILASLFSLNHRWWNVSRVMSPPKSPPSTNRYREPSIRTTNHRITHNPIIKIPTTVVRLTLSCQLCYFTETCICYTFYHTDTIVAKRNCLLIRGTIYIR